VDVAAVYRVAAERQAHRLRRWRRAALVAAAAALALVLGRGLEVRFEAHQLVLRWGQPPEPTLPMPPVVEAPVVPAPAPAPPTLAPELEERLRSLTALVQGLADEAVLRDDRQRQEVARLQAELALLKTDLVLLRQHDVRRWAAVERDIVALYNAQFPARKGNVP
jgi:hypothetical protein